MTAHDRTPAPPLDESDLAALEDRVARLHAALTAHPRRMQEAWEIKHEDDPWDWIPDVVAALRAAWRQRDELRAILEPLLDSPILFDSHDGENCTFCQHHGQEWSWIEPVQHRSDCPVLRADALLGRDRAPAHPAGDAT